MLHEYIETALMQAIYDSLEDGSYVATVPQLRGVIAIGDSPEERRSDLFEVIEEWIAARLRWGYQIPPIGGQVISFSKEPTATID